MYEKVSPGHPDKVADRIAGAILDFACVAYDNPRIAVEITFGHGIGMCIVECDQQISVDVIEDICSMKAIEFGQGQIKWDIIRASQDSILESNQQGLVRCGDNGIFKGCPVSREQQELADIAGILWDKYHSDGKYLLNRRDKKNKELTICQAGADWLPYEIREDEYKINFNPLGYWEGGSNVDSGAINRKLGSDMGDAVTGGGLHGKDVSKADVTLNIICHVLAQKLYVPVYSACSIGDTRVRFWTEDNLIHERELLDEYSSKSFDLLSKFAFEYIQKLGGFEKFAEWGLIRPRVKRGCYEKNSLWEMRREPPSKFLCRNNDIAGVERESLGVRCI